jgi:catechol 2,3-dioxygenase-like lactoylglutathione lyase family enzyme
MKKIILALWLIPFFGTLQAQEKYSFTFNHLALSVKKLEESATFYAAVLQLQVMVRHEPWRENRSNLQLLVGIPTNQLAFCWWGQQQIKKVLF